MSDAFSAERLLEEVDWLKRLAVALAGDSDDADDLVQESWIAFWRRRPDSTRPLRPWVSKVMRDAAGMKRGAERRRHAREETAPVQPPPAEPDELLEQMRLHRLLVDLVLELEEPWSDTGSVARHGAMKAGNRCTDPILA